VVINSKKFGRQTKTKQEIEKLVSYIDSLREEDKIKEVKKLAEADKLLPSFYVIGKLIQEYGFKPCSIEINSNVPKNLGSSASVSNAIVYAYLKLLGLELSTKEIAEFANEGDKVVHGRASGIDAFTIAYGGWLTYRKSRGIKPLEIDFEFPLLIVDSGEPSNTSETVGHIEQQKEKNSEFVDSILDKLNSISNQALKVIKDQDLEEIGNLMVEYYEELRKLNISTKKLDEIIKIALRNKAFAKPTGGWGGGCCIVLASNLEKLEKVYKAKGYKVFRVRLGTKGVS
jgi:mevalonate kinase